MVFTWSTQVCTLVWVTASWQRHHLHHPFCTGQAHVVDLSQPPLALRLLHLCLSSCHPLRLRPLAWGMGPRNHRPVVEVLHNSRFGCQPATAPVTQDPWAQWASRSQVQHCLQHYLCCQPAHYLPSTCMVRSYPAAWLPWPCHWTRSQVRSFHNWRINNFMGIHRNLIQDWFRLQHLMRTLWSHTNYTTYSHYPWTPISTSHSHLSSQQPLCSGMSRPKVCWH